MSGSVNEYDTDDLEGALRGLKPSAALSRDAVIFSAGKAAARRRGSFWPVCTLAMTAVAAALGVRSASDPVVVVEDRIVYVTVKEPVPVLIEPRVPGMPAKETDTPADVASDEASAGTSTYFTLMRQLDRYGADYWPVAVTPAAIDYGRPPATLESLRLEMGQMRQDGGFER